MVGPNFHYLGDWHESILIPNPLWQLILNHTSHFQLKVFYWTFHLSRSYRLKSSEILKAFYFIGYANLFSKIRFETIITFPLKIDKLQCHKSFILVYINYF